MMAHHDDHDHAHHDDHDHAHHDEESHDHGHSHHGEAAALLSKNGNRKDYSQFDKEAKLEAAKKRNVNLNAAYIHVLADLAQSAV